MCAVVHSALIHRWILELTASTSNFDHQILISSPSVQVSTCARSDETPSRLSWVTVITTLGTCGWTTGKRKGIQKGSLRESTLPLSTVEILLVSFSAPGSDQTPGRHRNRPELLVVWYSFLHCCSNNGQWPQGQTKSLLMPRPGSVTLSLNH